MNDDEFKSLVTLETLRRMVKPTGHASDRKSTAYALRLARLEGLDVYEQVLAHALAERAQWRALLGKWQREWQSRTSRRPQRGRHHDSWAIRERYVRCSNGGGR